MVALGVLVLVIGLLMPLAPTARAQGWRAVLPLDLQVRLLRFTDDADTWSRVASASAAGGLTAEADARLRAGIKGRLLEPAQDATPAVQAARILRPWNRSGGSGLFDRDELARIAAEGAPPARSYAIAELGGMVPPTPEQAEQRRRAWPQAAGRDRQTLLEWIMRHPAGQEDLEIIRAAFMADPWSTSIITDEKVVQAAPPEVLAIVVGLLDDTNPQVRIAGVMCFEPWLRDRNDKPPLDVQRRILAVMLDDSNTRVVSRASRSIENLSPELGETIGEGLAAATRPYLVQRLLHGIRRRDDPSVLPALERAALQPERPIDQRLEIAHSFEFVARRTRQPAGEPRFTDLYAEVIDGLMAADPGLILAMGRLDQVAHDGSFLLALTRRIGPDTVTIDGLNDWFAAHPALAAVLAEAVPGEADHAAAIRALFEQLRAGIHHETAAELWTSFHQWFPDMEGGPN